MRKCHSSWKPRPRPPRIREPRALTAGPGVFYQAILALWRFSFACTMRVRSHGLDHTALPGGCLLAVSHVSHLDPVLVSVRAQRPVSWIARREFYDFAPAAWFLHRVGAFPVNRQGAALPTVREALGRLARGEMVGIFPEGEILHGEASVVRGGSVKRGVALLAARSGCPVLPIVVAGTDKLNCLGPWLPARRGRLWIRAGEPLTVGREGRTRQGRDAFALRLEAEMRRLFQEMRQDWDLPESIVP